MSLRPVVIVLLLCALGSARGLAAQPASPPRVVTLAPHLAELVCAVGACASLVGVSAYTDYPPRAAATPRIGDAFAANAEAILALHPTRVLYWEGGTPAATEERLRRLHLPLHGIAVTDLEGVGAALEQVGALLDRAEQGRSAASAYEKKLAALRARYAGLRRLRAFYFIETDPPLSISRRSPIHSALDVCGADNVFADLPAIAAPVNLETVIAADPQIAVYSNRESAADVARLWRRLRGLQLTQPGRQVRVDATLLTRPGPRMLDGIAQLCAGVDVIRRRISDEG